MSNSYCSLHEWQAVYNEKWEFTEERLLDAKEKARWLTQDRFAEKYYSSSPYSYALGNPIKYIDINGDSTYVVIHRAGYLNYQNQGRGYNVGNGFKNNAEAYAAGIRNREGFDSSRDAVVVVGTKSTDQFLAVTNTTYETGKIAELVVFSHGYMGGISLGGQSPNDPGVTQSMADAQLNNYDLREINSNTAGNIDRSNFEADARTIFFGCNLGGTNNSNAHQSFAQVYANYMGGTVRAFTGGSEFTTSGGAVTYPGRMIRSADRATQQTRQIMYQRNQQPIFP